MKKATKNTNRKMGGNLLTLSLRAKSNKFSFFWVKNGGPLSLGPIPSGRLKNLKDVDKWSSLSLCLSVRGMQVTMSLYSVQSNGSNRALSPVVYGDIVLSIKNQIQYTIPQNYG